MISVVIPTYNEAAVIPETLRRAAAALKSSGEPYELLVVDDGSPDGTADVAQRLGDEFPVRVLRRAGRLGLATAVLEGWAIARGDVLGAMDADLQHPPEVLRDLVETLKQPDVDLVIASRYRGGGGAKDWSYVRRFISWGATHLASCVLPLTLAEVTDPMSGMFLVRRSALEGVRLSPLGYKILLEVLGKAHYRKFTEVAYVFEERGKGSSKLGARQYLEYVLHLARLARATGQMAAWFRYGAVALAGAIVDVALVYLLYARAAWPLVAALPAAVELALLNNFLWNETLTFQAVRAEKAVGEGHLTRLLRYQKVCLPGAILNGLLTAVAFHYGLHIAFAAACGVVAGSVWNMAFSLPGIWRVWGIHRPPERESLP